MAANRDFFTKDNDDILVVDDTISSLQMMDEILSKAGYKTRPVEDPQLALKAALAQPPDLILLDVRMPKMSGFELSRLLKKDDRTRDVPIIFVSALEDTANKVLGFEAGGIDFISKPYQEAEILARVDTHLQLRKMQLGLEGIVEERTAELRQKNKTLKREIEKRVRAEDQIRLSEEKFRGVFESMIDVFIRTDMKGICLMVSPSIYDLTGYTQDEVISMDLRKLYAIPDERDRIIKILLESRKIKNFEFETLHKNGNRIPVSVNSRIVYDGDDKPLYIEGNIRDISEKKKAEAEHDKLFNVSLDLLCITGFDGYFKELNPAWEKVTGYSREELCSKPFMVFIHPDDLEKTKTEFQKLNEGVVSLNFENRYITKSGKVIYLSWTVAPMLEESLMYGIARDVTEKKKIEVQLQEYQQRLKGLANDITLAEERVRKQIATDLHDHVGQMLSSIRMQLSRVSSKLEDPDTSLRLNSISKSIQKTIQATREAIFSLSLPELDEIGLYAAIHNWMKEEVEGKHRIKTSIKGQDIDIHLDENTRTLIFRSVKEMMNNVVKHARAHSINVELRIVEGMLEVTVADDGIGFIYNPELLRLKSNSYGLFSIQERVSDMGGSMEVESGKGKGTAITISIPHKEKAL